MPALPRGGAPLGAGPGRGAGVGGSPRGTETLQNGGGRLAGCAGRAGTAVGGRSSAWRRAGREPGRALRSRAVPVPPSSARPLPQPPPAALPHPPGARSPPRRSRLSPPVPAPCLLPPSLRLASPLLLPSPPFPQPPGGWRAACRPPEPAGGSQPRCRARAFVPGPAGTGQALPAPAVPAALPQNQAPPSAHMCAPGRQ